MPGITVDGMDVFAVYDAAGHVAEPDLPLGEQVPTFAALSDIDTVAWDFRTMNHSARSHLLEPFRAELTAKGLPDARTVSRMHDGRRVEYAGIVNSLGALECLSDHLQEFLSLGSLLGDLSEFS